MSSTEQTAVPALPPKERLLILAELFALTALSWLYLVRMPMSATDFGAVVVRLAAPISPGLVNFWLAFMMWAVMMVAMMLPGAAPMILMYARIARSSEGASAAGPWAFAGGYVVIWTMFSAAATVTQSALQHFAIISNGLSTAPIVGAAILVGAGVYQLTPLKQACLGHCQSPVAFFMTHWRAGTAGAFRMGLAHGAFCVGCCWMLMALLFAVGVMNLAWVAALSAFVLLEKLTPYPRAIRTFYWRGDGSLRFATGTSQLTVPRPSAMRCTSSTVDLADVLIAPLNGAPPRVLEYSGQVRALCADYDCVISSAADGPVTL